MEAGIVRRTVSNKTGMGIVFGGEEVRRQRRKRSKCHSVTGGTRELATRRHCCTTPPHARQLRHGHPRPGIGKRPTTTSEPMPTKPSHHHPTIVHRIQVSRSPTQILTAALLLALCRRPVDDLTPVSQNRSNYAPRRCSVNPLPTPQPCRQQ
jgi:hypothetical protein